MIYWGTFLLGAVMAAGILLLFWRCFWRRQGYALRAIGALLGVCAVFLSFAGTELFPAPRQRVELTALGEKNAASEGFEIYLDGFVLDGQAAPTPENPASGQWNVYNGRTCWFPQGDQRRQAETTERIVFELDAAWNTQARFFCNKWKGMVRLQVDGRSVTADTYSAAEGSELVAFTLPRPGTATLCLAVLAPVAGYALTLFLLGLGLCVLTALGKRLLGPAAARLSRSGPAQKLQGYQFLFEELVKRDFKKKYKRTVLGMAWSVLSPLLTLLVMRLVFTQFFGRGTAHYTTYLFCGNLVFSYFNEATSQGMTSLMGNSHIFTKVNVPKYLFLFSKNVQTLINFGLTLCVFFVFCVLDNIAFTWKFICLLYPIVCLVLFNIGVGLILSALYVFFRDIQYLWSVFTMLLMYMSAIFYTIDSYPPMVQNIFLLNPVYLFIRYFRKIVIEATIPSLWFHLLMLADVVIAVGLGCWMYKKNNTKFLYYV